MTKFTHYIAVASTLLLASHVNAANDNFDKVKREMNIMSNILKASFKEEKKAKIRRIESQYLKGQGVTFTLSTSFAGHRFEDMFAGLEGFTFDGNVFDFDHEEYEQLAHEATQKAMEVVQMSADKIHELAEKERELAYDIRRVEREKRDLDFERRHSEKANASELEQRIQQLEKQVSELEEKRVKLDKMKRDKKAELKQKALKSKKEAVDKQRELVQVSVRLIGDTLCDYGAGLKSIDEEQFINFVIKNGAGSSQDLILVFAKKDVNKCVTGKLSATELLTASSQYTF